MDRINELKELIIKYDSSYRKGEPLVPDNIYDDLVDELVDLIGIEDEFFKSSIKEEIDSLNRREKLPIIMASMNKVKKIEEIVKWMRLKNITENTEFIIMPKFDGISLAKDEINNKAWTRGSKDNLGLRSEDHLNYMKDVQIPDVEYTWGEGIIPRINFDNVKDDFEGESLRNFVSGIFRRDETSEILNYVDYIKYGCLGKDFKTKKDMLDYLNSYQKVKVDYKINKVSELTEEYLKTLYSSWSQNYEIDGLIIEVNDISLWEKLGRERNNNPKYAIAYKGSFEEVGETICIDIEWDISKGGNLIPVAILNPIKLDNAMVSRVTLNNASFMKEMGIGIGSNVCIIRSGAVIPKIIKILNKVEFKYPDIECDWNGVHLKTKYETDDQKKKKILSFFQILEVENVSDKTVDLLWNSDYQTIKDILNMSEDDFRNLERFGDRKASNVYNAIHSKLKDVSLSKLQHASNIFSVLGSKKLLLLEHFKSKPTLEKVMKIEGFSYISAEDYLNGYDKFFEFIKDLPITIKKTEKVKTTDNSLKNKIFVFTGYRSTEFEKMILEKNGELGSSISKKTSYLCVKDINSNSSKIQKALELGVQILDMEQLKNLLNV